MGAQGPGAGGCSGRGHVNGRDNNANAGQKQQSCVGLAEIQFVQLPIALSFENYSKKIKNNMHESGTTIRKCNNNNARRGVKKLTRVGEQQGEQLKLAAEIIRI